jgi:hypothetical protein
LCRDFPGFARGLNLPGDDGEEMSETLILAGQLLGTAFACGLNLYATVALLGAGARLDLIADLPPGMSGLENGLVIATAGALYIVEAVVDRVPILDHAWEAAHTLIRPAAAGLLVFLAFQDTALYLQLGATAAAVIVALAAHGTKAGLRLIVSPRWVDEHGRIRPRRGLARTGVSLLEDLAVVGIAIAALLYPALAVGVLAAGVVLILLGGPRLWRAAFLGFRAVVARLRSLFDRAGWRSRDQLPRGVRRALPPEPLGRRPLRAIPVAVTGMPHIAAYQHGWLVFTCDGPRFVYRSLFRARTTDLAQVSGVSIRRGILTDALDVHPNGNGRGRTVTFHLLKDGPPPHLAAAELTTGKA